MNKFLLILFFGLFGYASYAQVGGIYYQPSTPAPNYQNSYPDQYSQPYHPRSSYQGRRYYQSQPQQRAMRTTAYSFDSYSNRYVKHPIKVIEKTAYGRITYVVVEEYLSTGYGGQWIKVNAPVSECMSAYSNLNTLEGQFTHKANVCGTIYYFDL